MGVMPCYRDGCHNIMCHLTVLKGSHRICGDCMSELQDYKNTWEPPMSEAEVEQKIIDFMDSVPGSTRMVETQEDIASIFERLTRQRQED